MMTLFDDDQIRPDLLRRHAYLRWAALPPDVIPLTAAEPDFKVAREISEVVKDHAECGLFLYSSPEGEPSLRATVADVLRERHGISCDPDHVVPTLGTAAAIWMVVNYLCKAGDECIIMDPVDLLFGLAVDSAGARRVYFSVDRRTGRFDVDELRSLITPRTRLLCLCNPCNPLGLVMTEEELRAIGELAVERGLMILADEVWSEIVYAPRRHVSIARLSAEIARQTITITGPSKTFGIPGLRIGFIAPPSRQVADDLHQTAMKLGTAFGLSPLAQSAAEVAYKKCWYWRDAFLEHLRRMRDYAVDRLERMPGITCKAPEGTYILFPKATDLKLSSQELADFLLQQARVAVVPGTREWFGPGAEGHVRICFSTSLNILREGLDRIEHAVARLGA